MVLCSKGHGVHGVAGAFFSHRTARGSIINKTALNVFISANYHYSDHGHKNKTDLGGLNLKGLGVLILVAQITFILNHGSFSSGLSTIQGH